jgi:hypothetical protein
MESVNRATPPPATATQAARPKNSSSHAAASSSQQPATMVPSARTVRGGTPTANRSTSKLVDEKAATRPASRDSLKQKMLKKPEDAPRPTKADEVRTWLGPGLAHNGTTARPANTAHSSSRPSGPTSTACARTSRARSATACSTSLTPYHAATHTATRWVHAHSIRCTCLTRSSACARGSPTTRTARHAPTAASSSRSCPPRPTW